MTNTRKAKNNYHPGRMKIFSRRPFSSCVERWSGKNIPIQTIHELAGALNTPFRPLEDRSSGYREIVLMLSAYVIGQDVMRLVAFTGYSRDFIAEVKERLERSGLWIGGKFFFHYWDVFDDLLDDIYVCQGIFRKSKRGKYLVTQEGERKLAGPFYDELQRIMRSKRQAARRLGPKRGSK